MERIFRISRYMGFNQKYKPYFVSIFSSATLIKWREIRFFRCPWKGKRKTSINRILGMKNIRQILLFISSLYKMLFSFFLNNPLISEYLKKRKFLI